MSAKQNYDAGRLLYEQDQYDLAIDAFKKALEEAPDFAEAKAFLALCLAERKQWRQASQLAGEAIANNPGIGFPHYVAARVLWLRNFHLQALEEVTKAIEIEAEVSSYYGLEAMIRIDMQEWEAALESAGKGLAIDAEDAYCRNAKAMALTRLGRAHEALPELEAMLRKHPEDALALANLGWARLALGDREAALNTFRAALRLDAEDRYAREGMLQSLRLYYPVYGMILRGFLWMSKLRPLMQGQIMMLSMFIEKLLAELEKRFPWTRYFIRPLMTGWNVFGFLTWISRPLTSLLLRAHPYGRNVLNEDEVNESSLIGGMIGLGLLSFLLSFWVRHLGFVAALTLILIIPASSIWNCSKGWPRQVMGSYTGVLALLGLLAFGLLVRDPFTDSPGHKVLAVFLVGVSASSLLANLLTRVRQEGDR
ncbi:MAG: tetratricopeptide repeat protein [Candidatus Xenobia bacterium]